MTSTPEKMERYCYTVIKDVMKELEKEYPRDLWGRWNAMKYRLDKVLYLDAQG